MSKPSSRFVGTVVLTISLLLLQGALWNFRPQQNGETSPELHSGFVSIHGGNRKLLEANVSLDSAENQQQVS